MSRSSQSSSASSLLDWNPWQNLESDQMKGSLQKFGSTVVLVNEDLSQASEPSSALASLAVLPVSGSRDSAAEIS